MAHWDDVAEYFINTNSSESKTDGGSLAIPDGYYQVTIYGHLWLLSGNHTMAKYYPFLISSLLDLLAKFKLNVRQTLNVNKTLCRA